MQHNNINLFIMKRTIISFAAIFVVAFLSSCTDDEPELLVEDSTVGVERFLMQLLPGYSNPHIGKVSENNLVTYQGYVMPNYLKTTDVFVTVTASRDIGFSYQGEIKELRSEFQIDELFEEGSSGVFVTFFNLKFFSDEPGTIGLTLNFRNSLGSKFPVEHTIILE